MFKHSNYFSLLSLAVLILVGAGCSTTTAPTTPGGSIMGGTTNNNDAMKEHCKVMPEMPGCEKYRTQPIAVAGTGTTVDRSVAGLSDAVSQMSVSLNNKDSYALNASFVKKSIKGNTIRLLSYNGQVPGPLLRVKQGSSASIVFTNNLDEPTTIHWHGLRLDNQFDGVPDVTQPTVKPGESYTYQLKFPDAGLYWYHPHLREDYQQNLGMYGLIWVEPTVTTTFDPVNKEEFITLSDMLMAGTDVAPFDKDHINHTLMGRFGNTMLVNGDMNYSLNIHQGDVVRFGIVNAASTRVFRVTIPGVKLKLIGADSGGYAHDSWVDSVTLSPSERVLVEVKFDAPGTYQLKHVSPAATYSLGTITVAATKNVQDYSKEFLMLKDRSADFTGLATYYDKPIDKQLDLTINMPGMMAGMNMGGGTTDGIEWEDSMAMMNQSSNEKSLTWIIKDHATGLENDKIDYTFKQGDKIKIRLFNDPKSMHPMQHTIHFHGNRFVVLAVNSKKNTNLVWKDSVLVPSGATVDILLDASNPGTWMAHCHIAEHLEDGMMFTYKVQ